MVRKRKISLLEIPDYYSYKRFRNKEHDVSGYIYYLCNRLSSDEIHSLMTDYHNTEIAYGHSQYAPEISRNFLIVYDKCIR